MSIKPLLLLFFATCCLSCHDNQVVVQLLDKAESLLVTQPDSVHILLDSISNPGNFNNKLFARWCMLYAKSADKLHEDMPSVNQLLRAKSWYDNHGSAEEQAWIGFFLGRSYVEDKEFAKAMKAYVSALRVAERRKCYNVAGYICSYTGDLYEFDDKPQIALEKYKEGGNYFLKAGNKRSYALALRDVGHMWSYSDSCVKALYYMKKADSIVTALHDIKAMASTANGLGNIYGMLERSDSAEFFLLKSLELNENEKAPSCLALSKIYLDNGDLGKACFYLEKSKIKTKNEATSIGILYQYYLVKKASNNLEQALYYLEQYEAASDSVSTLQNNAEVMKMEKKYRNEKILNENTQLRVKRQQNMILFIIVLIICLGIFIIYQILLKRKQLEIFKQQRKLDQNRNNIRELSTKLKEGEIELSKLKIHNEQIYERDTLEQELKNYHKQKEELEQISADIIQLRREKLLLSAIGKKIIKLSKKVIPGVKCSLLTDKDWKAIRSQIDETYLSMTGLLEKRDLNLTPLEIDCCYLAFFKLDLKEEAILLNISPNTASKRHSRLREKLGIGGKEMSLYDYLTEM